MTDVFKKDTVCGLKCLAGENITEKMREHMRNNFDVCENCVIHYNKKKLEPCVRLVCEYAIDYLKELQVEDNELLQALECLACKRHKEPAYVYLKYSEEECSVCKYGPRKSMDGKSCSKAVAKDALNAIETATGKVIEWNGRLR